MQKAEKIVFYCLIIKLALAAYIPFFYDEAYYWFWGNNLRLSYYDHPPFVSYLYFLGQGFDWLADKSANHDDAFGRGLMLVKTLCEKVWFEHNGSKVSCVLNTRNTQLF